MKKENVKKNFIPIPDDENSMFLFSTTNTKLLVEIVKGKIDANVLAQKELRARGLDDCGKWIGFNKKEPIKLPDNFTGKDMVRVRKRIKN